MHPLGRLRAARRDDAVRRRSRRRDATISTISTIVFFALVAALIALSPGIKQSGRVVLLGAPASRTASESVSSGFWLNVKLMLISEALVLDVRTWSSP